MAEITPEAGSQIGAHGAAGPTAEGENDPFLKLHKMSTTAGLGSGDYVAINGSAVVAILLGITSAFVLMGGHVLLLIPIIGIIFAIVAFEQVGNSNGTQTGKGLAAIGMLLSLGFGGYVVVKEGTDSARNSADEKAVVAVIHQLGDLISQEKYTQAYGLYDSRFTERVPQDKFVNRWRAENNSPVIGQISGLDWNNLLKFENDPVTGERQASGMVLFKYAKVPGTNRHGVVFRKVGQQWLIDDIPDLFPPPGPAGAARGQ